jgi:hypothetical protein
MTAMLDAKMDANQQKMEARLEANNKKFEVLQSTLSTLVSWMDIHQARREAVQEEIIAKMDAHQERLGASMNAWRKEMMASQEVTEACLESKEPTSVQIVSIEVHEEVPKEEAAVKTVRALTKQYGDRHLATGHTQQLKKQTQGDSGSQKKLAAAHRWMTHCAIPAPCKAYNRQGPGRDNVARGTLRGQMFEKRHQAQLEGSN